MKKIIYILVTAAMLMSISACNTAKPVAAPKNVIMPSSLTREQQEILDLFAIADFQELMLFDFNTEESYKSIEAWVEVYHDGELVDRPAGVGRHSNIGELHDGRLAITVNQDNTTFQWTLSMVDNGSRSGHTGKSEIDGSGLARAYGSINDPAIIEDGKEIILYSSYFSGEDLLPFYDGIYIQEHPEIISDYPYVQLIKIKFSNDQNAGSSNND